MKQKILVVDDTETMRHFQRLFLEAQGYEVALAEDGIDALDKIPAFGPDLILMDCTMPRMDGLECCRRIKADGVLREVKVIMVTSKSEYDHIRDAFAAGCDDYVTKPVDRTELLLKTRDLLKFSHLKRVLRSG
ncbi:MAG: response regulator [Deltaproteobacteria bacterium]|nr:response regulator [Deltaproteobacteria bacterium]